VANTKVGVIIHGSLAEQLFSQADRLRLASLGEIHWTTSRDPIDSAAAIDLLRHCEIGLGSWKTPRPDAAMMAACPKLKAWIHVGGSPKQIFGPHLDGRQFVVGCCAPAIADAVAEMTVASLLMGLKRVLENSISNRTQRATKPTNSRNLSSCTIGVIAASQVGMRVMKLLRQFGSTVQLFDPYVTQEQADEWGVRLVPDLMDLCRSSDAVTVHAPLLPSTYQMLQAKHFQAMRPSTVFVNTSKGSIVDEKSLIQELQRGRLFAFLDVSDPEPAAIDSPLRTLSNVVYTSHIAGGADLRLGKQAVDDIAAYLDGKPMTMQVTRDMLDRIA
jgi:phosphoglycerate dehydrogenase-like enzyme